jgi:tRNA (uracil-5-)-methyltransferase TRM9
MIENEKRQYIDQNRDVYNTIAPFFASTRAFLWSDMAVFADMLSPHTVLVDVGCGNGRVYTIAQEKQVRYIGVDQSIELLRIGSQMTHVGVRDAFADNAMIDVSEAPMFVLADMRQMPIPDSSADAVWCIASLQHLPTVEDRICALREIYRILKPGGRALCMNWNLYSRHASTRHAPFAPGDFLIPWKHPEGGRVLGERYYHGLTQEEMRELLSGAGFTDIVQYYTRRGARSDMARGMNLVSVACKT